MTPGKQRTGLTHVYAGGPAAHNETQRTKRDLLRTAARRKKAWRIWTREDVTYEQLGARTGVSGKTAHGDVQAMLRALRESGLADAETLRGRQAANIRELLGPHLQKKRNVGNARVALGLLEHEARLFGLHKKPEGTYTVEQVVAMLRALASDLLNVFVEDDQRRAILAAFRRRLGQGAGATVDVTPERQDGEG